VGVPNKEIPSKSCMFERQVGDVFQSPTVHEITQFLFQKLSKTDVDVTDLENGIFFGNRKTISKDKRKLFEEN
jgi:hypothetical protein